MQERKSALVKRAFWSEICAEREAEVLPPPRRAHRGERRWPQARRGTLDVLAAGVKATSFALAQEQPLELLGVIWKHHPLRQHGSCYHVHLARSSHTSRHGATTASARRTIRQTVTTTWRRALPAWNAARAAAHS